MDESIQLRRIIVVITVGTFYSLSTVQGTNDYSAKPTTLHSVNRPHHTISVSALVVGYRPYDDCILTNITVYGDTEIDLFFCHGNSITKPNETIFSNGSRTYLFGHKANTHSIRSIYLRPGRTCTLISEGKTYRMQIMYGATVTPVASSPKTHSDIIKSIYIHTPHLLWTFVSVVIVFLTLCSFVFSCVLLKLKKKKADRL